MLQGGGFILDGTQYWNNYQISANLAENNNEMYV